MSDSRVRSRYDTVQGREVHALAAAPGPDRQPRCDVVVVHGLAVSSRYLRPCLELLAADRRVFAPDLPGVGRSARPPQAVPLSQLATWLADWMNVVGLADVAVIGHSLGCHVVADLASRFPDRVRSVVLANPAPDPSLRPPWRQVWGLLRDAPRERASLVPIAVSDYLQASTRRSLRALREAKQRDAGDNLPEIQAATLVLAGGSDPLVSPEWAHRLIELLPAGRLAVLPRSPHAAHYSTPVRFADTVRRFLDDTAAEGA